MTSDRTFTIKEILDGWEMINQALIRQNLPTITLEQYKETLKYPISDELLPRYPQKNE